MHFWYEFVVVQADSFVFVSVTVEVDDTDIDKVNMRSYSMCNAEQNAHSTRSNFKFNIIIFDSPVYHLPIMHFFTDDEWVISDGWIIAVTP